MGLWKDFLAGMAVRGGARSGQDDRYRPLLVELVEAHKELNESLSFLPTNGSEATPVSMMGVVRTNTAAIRLDRAYKAAEAALRGSGDGA